MSLLEIEMAPIKINIIEILEKTNNELHCTSCGNLAS